MALIVHQFPCLSDNYGFLIRDEASGQTACIDTPEAGAILRELEDLDWGLDYILTTGQEDAKALLYAPLPDELAQQAIAQIDEITVG